MSADKTITTQCPTCGKHVNSIFDHVDIECDQAYRMDGLFAGQFQPEEYEPLVEAGVLKLTYEGVGGFLGLAKLRAT